MTAWPRRSTTSGPSATPRADGHSRTPIPARCTSRSTRARAIRADGIPCARAGAALVRGQPCLVRDLLSPFDNLVWDRRFMHRFFGLDHVIEIYKRAPERRYGYYVLPFLWRDRIVGRADLKSDRSEGALLVEAFHLEP